MSEIEMAEKRSQLCPQKSTVWMRRQQAVCVRGAFKRYGNQKNGNVILDGLSMTVPKGCIYGLLGASGCGKTTLLSCIIGRRRLNFGEIWVLGGKPGSAGSGVPGPRIGYMPQETALIKEFTIRESMYYFGWINGLSNEEINDKVEFLVNFLMLPSADKYVQYLSGGEQRRVSLACALVHHPELLILDEPTVGVDPILRQRIWDYLIEITNDGSTTAIITTHYIDETRQANTIGFLRCGRLLTEASPDELLQKYSSDSLENVFLKLSVIQNGAKLRRCNTIESDLIESLGVSNISSQGTTNMAFDSSSETGEHGEMNSLSSFTKQVSFLNEQTQIQSPDIPPDDNVEFSLRKHSTIFSGDHVKALVWKNFLLTWRNVATMLFIFALPVVQITLFCLYVGKNPVDLSVAVVNREVDMREENCTYLPTTQQPKLCDPRINATNPSDCPTSKCSVDRLSCQYLEILQHKKQSMEYYDTVEEAKHAVYKGKAWMVLEFPPNFTDALYKRYEKDQQLSMNVFNASEINVWMDQTNKIFFSLFQRDLYDAFNDLTQTLAKSCGFNSKILNIPIQFNRPIYGQKNANYRDFIAPGMILSITFIIGVASTLGPMLAERNEGIFERNLVSGVTEVEVLLGHVGSQFTILVIQVMATIGITLLFELTMEGNILTIYILTGLTGLSGMCFGFLACCITDNERSATYIALGNFVSLVMVSGIIWPREAMHEVLRSISYTLPLTLSTESLRSVMARGWNITKPTVYLGFVSTVIWIALFSCFSILLIKFKKG